MRVTVVRMGPPTWSWRGLLFLFVVNAAGLWLAAALVPGIEIDDAPSLIAVTAIFAIVNTFVRPLAYLLTACLIVLTFGLFIIVVNAAMLGLTAWIADWLDLGFHVDGFWSAIFGSLIISFVSILAMVVARMWRIG